jgi:methyl-accepting chemotaxis protein
MRLFNFSFMIGTKLAIMSGMGIAMVLIMIGSTVYGNSEVGKAMDFVKVQTDIASDLADAALGLTSARLAVRDILLADNAAELKRAGDDFETNAKGTNAIVDKVLEKSRSAENRERVQKVKELFAEYINAGRKMMQLRQDFIATVASERREAIDDQLSTMVKDRAAGAAKMMELADQSGDFAKASAGKAMADADHAMAMAQYLMLGVASVVILLLIGSAIFGAVSIARPLARLVPELKKLAEGDFNVAIPGIGRKDEIGQIAEAAEMVADRVGATIVNIKMSASEVTNASAEISTSTTDLSQRTEEQAASLEETSASMEEMTSTVKKNAENAKQASELASSTREVADRGGQVVAKTVEAMAKIEESSRKISDIIIVIDEIARQTNLLALNAAVEAARAGDAGRGFAVVASEVRSLAQRSSQAAKDIKDLITNSTDQVKDGVELVNKAGHSLNEIVESIKKVTVVVSEIANASMEQSTGIEQINRALTQMDEVTQQNSALVEENAATAKTLEEQAKSMDERVAIFKVRPMAGEAARAASPVRQSAERNAPIMVSRSEAAAKRPAATAPKRAAGASRTNGTHRGPVGRMQAGLAVALNDEPDWKEF